MKQYITFDKEEFEDWYARLRAQVSWMMQETIMRNNNWSREDAIDYAFKKMKRETGLFNEGDNTSEDQNSK